MHVIWSPDYEVDIGPHVFPTLKYRLVKERLVEEGVVSEEDVVPPPRARRLDLARVHTREYLRKIRDGDFTPAEDLEREVPFSPELRTAMSLCCGGSIECGRLALGAGNSVSPGDAGDPAPGIGVHLGGGFHHAFADHGEGFCLLNDVAVAARALSMDGTVDRVAIVDLDVHHGNGTAAIFADDPTVFTFSMHQKNNYPAVKPPGDLDVGLHDDVSDSTYLELLGEHLPTVLEEHAPDLVFYLAGADPYREDQLGGLGLTRDGLRRRDRAVLEACRNRGIAVAVTLAGGYALHTDDTIEIHCATVEEAVACASKAAN